MGFTEAMKAVRLYLSDNTAENQIYREAFQLGRAEALLAMLISGEMGVEMLRATVLGE